MPHKVGMPYDADVVDLYTSGMEAREVAEKLGIGRHAVFNALGRKGVKTRGKRLPAPSGVVERYEDGESVLELSKVYGVSRTVVNRWLTDAGCAIRNPSEAGAVRASRMTPEQRAEQTAAAHEAARGRHVSVSSMVKAARARESRATVENASGGERLVAETFAAHGYAVTLQKAVHIYNLDVAVGDRFAVEVNGGSWHAAPDRRKKETKRLEYLISAGWRLVYLWDTYYLPITSDAAEKCVSIFKMTSVDPSPDGEYWVVRGDGKVTTAARRYMTDDALILPTQARTNPDGSEVGLW